MDRAELLKILNNESVEIIARHAKAWQGDSADDEVARAIIASLRPIMEALTNPRVLGEDGEVSRLMLTLAMQHYQRLCKSVSALDALAELKKKGSE
jgi:hypothetical protein